MPVLWGRALLLVVGEMAHVDVWSWLYAKGTADFGSVASPPECHRALLDCGVAD